MSRKSSFTKSPARFWDWIALGIIVLFIGYIRVRLLSIPLERDEGEFAYMGQLILQGIPPYKLAYNMKFPGAYIAYALIMAVFGQSARAVHLGLLIANTISIALVFVLGRRLFGRLAGVVSAAAFALLSVHPAFLGTSAHATQFAVPLILGAMLLLLRASDTGERPKLFWCGVLLGMAVLVKQHAVFYVLFAALYYFRIALKTKPGNWRRASAGSGLILLGTAVPILATLGWLYKAGVFGSFWFWTVRYARQYVAETSPADLRNNLYWAAEGTIMPTLPMWLLSGIGLVALWWDKALREKREFLTCLLVFSLLSVCPGWYFRSHYFVLVLPPTALLIGTAVSAAGRRLVQSRVPRLAPAIPALVLASVWTIMLLMHGSFFFSASPVAACRQLYKLQPFPEAVHIADYIRDHSTADDQVAVLGSEPEICFYAHRHSATGFIYMYPLTEIQPLASELRGRLFREIQSSKPRYVVFISHPGTWRNSQAVGSNEILDWAWAYVSAHYRLVGGMDLLGDEYWPELWGQDAQSYVPGSVYYAQVFERVPGS